MSKEIESLKRIETTFSMNKQGKESAYRGYTNSFYPYYEDFDLVLKALQSLEAIDNSNPSEALECLEKVYSRLPQWDLSRNVDQCNTIKQALLKAQTQELNNGGRLPNKEILYLKQSLEQCNDKPIFYVSRTYGNKYIVQQKFLDDLTKENARNEEILQKYYQEGITLDSVRELKKENELLKEIIKCLFDRGCPLHQYIDKEGVLTIEVDNECSIMRLGEFKGVDLDAKLKEVLE